MQPFVSIGLPVYNGENYLREALDSLLAQDYQNFELIISDNASTDSTAEICQNYVAKDKRIKYFRAETNKGASWNFNRVLELSGGEFFMWAGHDDLWHPSFISKCVEALAKDETAAICHSQGQGITSDGTAVGESYIDFTNIENTVRERWRKTHENWQLHAAIYGLMRTTVVRKTAPIMTFTSSDLIFVAEISLYGKIIQIPETLQFKRLPMREEKRYQSPEAMMEYLGAVSVGKLKMVRLQIMRRCISRLKQIELSSKLRRQLIADTYRIYYASHLKIDVKETLKSMLAGSKK